MRSSNPSLAWFGILLFTIAGISGCAQGTGERTSPTAASSLVGGSAAITGLGPGASYDATGSWHFVATDQSRNSGEFDSFVTQDSDGNLSFLDDDGVLVTLTRLSSGRTISYKVSSSVAASPCNVDISGTAQVDTSTNTGRAHVHGVIDDCSRIVVSVILTKN